MKQASQAVKEEAAPAAAAAHDEHIAPAPRVSVQAFCENVDTAAAIQSAGEDRRMAKAHLRIQMGGMAAAVEAYQSAPTPNVIILESESRGQRDPDRARPARQLLRRRHARHRHRQYERCDALSRIGEARRQRLSDCAGRRVAGRARDLRALFGAGCQAGRPYHRRGRRQGRRRRLDRRAQHRLLDRARPSASTRS